MGAGQRNYEDLAQEMEMYTGGLSVSPHIVNHHSQLDRFELVSQINRSITSNVKSP